MFFLQRLPYTQIQCSLKSTVETQDLGWSAPRKPIDLESPSPGPVPAGSQAQLPWWCCSNLGCFMGAQTDTVILNSFWHVIWKYIKTTKRRRRWRRRRRSWISCTFVKIGRPSPGVEKLDKNNSQLDSSKSWHPAAQVWTALFSLCQASTCAGSGFFLWAFFVGDLPSKWQC